MRQEANKVRDLDGVLRTVREIARDYGISIDQVYPRIGTDSDGQRVIVPQKRATSPVTLARRLAVTAEHEAGAIKAPLPKKNRKNKPLEPVLVLDLDGALRTVAEIARDYGSSKNSVRNRLARHSDGQLVLTPSNSYGAFTSANRQAINERIEAELRTILDK